MVRAYRKLTGIVLLASYIAAMIGAWSHGRHDCRDETRLNDTASSYVCHEHGHASSFEPSTQVTWGDTEGQLGDPRIALRPLHEPRSHQLDQCLICQFLAVQKVLVLSGGSTPAAAVLAQRLDYPDHRLLVAERFGTPDSRGPPRAC